MKYITLILCFLLSLASYAQEAEMADEMRANGKIYVVVAIILVILLGLFIYLINIDRKLSRLEKKHTENTDS